MTNPLVVQVATTPGLFSNIHITATSTLTGVQQGNAILAAVVHSVSSGGAATAVAEGATNYGLLAREVGFGGSANEFALEAWVLPNVAAGTHNTVSTSTNENNFGQIITAELSGIVLASPGDQSIIANGNSTTPAVGPTGALAQVGELAIALCYPAVAAGITNPPTPAGWTSIYADPSSSDVPLYIATQVPGSKAGVSAAWGTLGSAQKWMALIVTLLPAAAPVAPLPPRRKPQRIDYNTNYPR